jgi:hypothetical protein
VRDDGAALVLKHRVGVKVLGPGAHDLGVGKLLVAAGGGQRVEGDAAVVPVLHAAGRVVLATLAGGVWGAD